MIYLFHFGSYIDFWWFIADELQDDEDDGEDDGEDEEVEDEGDARARRAIVLQEVFSNLDRDQDGLVSPEDLFDFVLSKGGISGEREMELHFEINDAIANSSTHCLNAAQFFELMNRFPDIVDAEAR
jgi:hypothetical protein